MSAENMMVEVHGGSYPGGLDLGLPKDAGAAAFRERGEKLLRDVAKHTNNSAHSISEVPGGIGRINQEYLFTAPISGSEASCAAHQANALTGLLCLLQAQLATEDMHSVDRQEDIKVQAKIVNNVAVFDLKPQRLNVSEKLQHAVKEAKHIFSAFAIGAESLNGGRTAEDEIRAFCQFSKRCSANTLMLHEIERIALDAEKEAGELPEGVSLADKLMEGYGPRAHSLVRSGYPATAFVLITDMLIERWRIKPDPEQREAIAEKIATRMNRYAQEIADTFSLPFQITTEHSMAREVKQIMGQQTGFGGPR